MVGCLLQLFQQLAGINTVMYYSAKIITMAGVSSKTLAIWLSAAVASMNFLWTIPGLILVEKIGRRKLLLASLFGMLIVELLHVFIISTIDDKLVSIAFRCYALPDGVRGRLSSGQH